MKLLFESKTELRQWIKMCSIGIIFLVISASVNAQNLNVGGVVKDVGGNAVAGAMVREKGTRNLSITDPAGRFSISVPAGATLVVSSMGLESQEIEVRNRTSFDITLSEDVQLIEDVVVVAYGQVRKEELTGSVGQVTVTDLMKAPVASFDQALAGRVAGVQVSSGEGQPGTEMEVVIRGGNSLTQSNSPLYVVDGFPMDDFSGAAINPEDIASISVLKDADATSVYGSRAANGVIVIQTKQSQKGRPVITYHGYVGVQSVSNTIEMMDSYEFVRYMLERDPDPMTYKYLTRPGFESVEAYRTQPTVDWQDHIFSSAVMQNHSLSLRGGTDRTRYNASASLFDQEGIVPNSGFKRYQGRIGLVQHLNSKLKVDLKANFSQVINYGLLASEQGSSNNSYQTYLLYQVWASRPVLREGENIYEDVFVDGEEDSESTRIFNPIVAANNQIRQQTANHFSGTARIDYTILPELTYTVMGGVTTRNTRNESFYSSKTYQGYPFSNNLNGVNGSFGDIRRTTLSGEHMLNYKKLIKKGHRVDFVIGMSYQQNKMDRYGFSVMNVTREDLGLASLHYGTPSSVTATRSIDKLASYFARAYYNLKGRYFFSASFRADGSSRFAPQNRWGYFPSGGFAWQLGKERFMKNIRFISDSKLRLSYGATGNNRVGDFSRYSTVNPQGSYYSFNNETPSDAARFTNLSYPDLKWETTIQANVGYDLSLFENRVNLTLDLYRKTTRDLLLDADLPGTTGFTSMYRNVGKIRNEGIEFSFTTRNIMTRDFDWESAFNISFNRNKVLALASNQSMLMSRVSWTNAFNSSNLYVARIGESAANYYGYIWDGNYQLEDFDVNPNGTYTLKKTVATNGASRESIQPGDIKYVDINGDRMVNGDDMTIIGRALPIHTGGFNNNFRYKNLSLNIFFQWSYGNQIFNANRLAFEGNFGNRNINQYATYVDRWTIENQNNTYFRTGGEGPDGMYSDRVLEDGSYLRLKTVQLSYSIPRPLVEKMKMSSIQVYLSGQDLWTLTNYSGMDPEVSVRHSTLTPGFDYSAYPRTRTVTFGIRAEF